MGRRAKDWKFRITFLAALTVFIFGAAKLGLSFWEYHKGAQQYQELEGIAGLPSAKMSDNKGNKSKKPTEQMDFDKLKKINPDVVGWIWIEKLGISYPIVQGKDNDYYLSHTFYREENKCGSIFVEVGNHGDFSDQNTFVYGHNMRDGSMFAKLNQYQDQEIFRENPEFYIYTPEGLKRYQIFSCYVASLDWDSFTYQFENQKAYKKWQTTVKKRSLYDTGIVPKPEQTTVTLMTCTLAGDNYRFLVHGVLTDKQSKKKK